MEQGLGFLTGHHIAQRLFRCVHRHIYGACRHIKRLQNIILSFLVHTGNIQLSNVFNPAYTLITTYYLITNLIHCILLSARVNLLPCYYVTVYSNTLCDATLASQASQNVISEQ